MERIIVKLVAESYEKDRDINNLLRYIQTDKRSNEVTRYIGAQNLLNDYRLAARSIMNVQKAYKKCKGRRIYHWIISFPPEFDDHISVRLTADSLAAYFSDKYQVFYSVHEDNKVLHIHMAMNSVSFVDGKKFHTSKKQFDRIVKDLKKIAGKCLVDEL